MSNVLRAPELYITDPQYNGKNLTNHVLIRKKSQKLTYYCPGYLRIKIKNFAGMSHDDLQATINVTLLLNINTKGIPDIVKQKMKSNIILRFNRDQALLLDNQNLEVKLEEGKNQLKYTVRKLIHSGMTSQIFLSPFEVINLIMSVNVQTLTFYLTQFIQDQIQTINDLPQQMRKFKIVQVRFNLMDLSQKQNPANKFIKISFTQEGTFGNYDLAQNKLRVQYTNQNTAYKIRNNSKKLTNNQIIDYSKLNQFSFAHFQIPLYKFPLVSLVTIFLPLWLLGIMNLGIFFQDNGLADRIGSLAGLMIAFVALIPVIRQQLPPNPNITFVQILVYIQTLTTLLCLIESIRVRESTTVFVWYNNGLFLTSMIIDILQFVIIAILMFIHYCHWLPSYNVHASEQTAFGFKYQQWYNQECDAHFRRKIDNGQILPLQYQKEMSKKREANENPLL